MDTHGPIVCATDLSPGGARAVDLAASAARDLSAPLRLVHAADTGAISTASWKSPAQRTLEERVRRRAAELSGRLAAERQRAAANGVTVEHALIEGRPHVAVIDDATRQQARMIVVGPHGETGPAEIMRSAALEWLLGITADRVLRGAPCPVLVASNRGDMPPLANGRWLVALDFEPASREALGLALRLAARVGATVTAAHALGAVPLTSLAEAPAPAADDWDPDAEETSARAHLEQVVAEARAAIPGAPAVVPRVVRGSPAAAITQLGADLGATLLVVGTHGRTGLAHGLLGSVAERILRRATVPVLVARSQS